ncbi:MAG: RNA polymerase sigma factor [Planctomycetota bacterium]
MNDAHPFPLRWLAAKGEAEASDAATEQSALLRRVQAGDDEAFSDIVRKYWNRAYWTAYDVLYDADGAQDVAQESFVKVHRAIASYDLGRDFASWLHRIVLNLAIDHKRRRDRDRSVPTDKVEQIVDARRAVVQDEEKAANIERVDRVLSGLPDKYRVPLTLKDIDGFSVEEIARILDVSYSTVRWRLHKARGLFRERWRRMLRKEEREQLR